MRTKRTRAKRKDNTDSSPVVHHPCEGHLMANGKRKQCSNKGNVWCRVGVLCTKCCTMESKLGFSNCTYHSAIRRYNQRQRQSSNTVVASDSKNKKRRRKTATVVVNSSPASEEEEDSSTDTSDDEDVTSHAPVSKQQEETIVSRNDTTTTTSSSSFIPMYRDAYPLRRRSRCHYEETEDDTLMPRKKKQKLSNSATPSTTTTRNSAVVLPPLPSSLQASPTVAKHVLPSQTLFKSFPASLPPSTRPLHNGNQSIRCTPYPITIMDALQKTAMMIMTTEASGDNVPPPPPSSSLNPVTAHVTTTTTTPLDTIQNDDLLFGNCIPCNDIASAIKNTTTTHHALPKGTVVTPSIRGTSLPRSPPTPVDHLCHTVDVLFSDRDASQQVIHNWCTYKYHHDIFATDREGLLLCASDHGWKKYVPPTFNEWLRGTSVVALVIKSADDVADICNE